MKRLRTSDVPRVDGTRLLAMLDELAAVGADSRGGVTRTGLSPADRAGRDLVASMAVSSGLVPRVDPAGNLIVTRPGAATGEPVMLMGSHLDTVPQGGRLDGAYGVVAALAVLSALARHGIPTRFEPVVVAYANEEGANFPESFFGSKALSGQLDVDVELIRGRDGQSLRDALTAFGGDPDRLAAAAWPRGGIGACLELHIEQGPVLETSGIPIGVVDAIAGRTTVEVAICGRAAHAGTTPMTLRRDALVAAARMVLAVERIATERDLCRVATVGWLEVAPKASNVVPGAVRLTVDLRDASPDRLARAESALMEEVRTACGTTAEFELDVLVRTSSVPMDPALRDAIRKSAAALGVAAVDVSSGAGHDAQIMAASAPTAMIFVPSRNGVSHVPEEDTSPEDLILGADVLLRTALTI